MKRKRENEVTKTPSLKKSKMVICPEINTLNELISLCKSTKNYENIDMNSLKKILPDLEELNNMIGMTSLKDSILFQIIYYLQKMHIPPNSNKSTRSKNQNEEYLHTVIQGAPGSGKCLGKDTKVMSYRGNSIKVQDLKIGDVIMGDDSKPRNILSICNGTEQLWLIKQSYGIDYTVNNSHILSLILTQEPIILFNLCNKFSVSWYDYYDFHIKYFNTYSECKTFIKTLPKIGDVIDIPISEYITRSTKWKDIYKGYKVSIDFPYKSLNINPYEYGLRIMLLNLFHINYSYLYNTKNIRLNVLAGIIDTFENHLIDKYHIYTKNKEIYTFIIKLCTSLGIIFKLKKNTNIYNIYLYGNINNIPCQYIKLKNNYKNLIENKIVYDINIEKKEIGEYYGFEIDGNKRFLLNDFTVTHNTSVAKIIGNIYQKLGVLSKKGETIIAYRDDFIGEHLGSTALKTKEVLMSALGGVLIIDEVYALGNPEGKDSFSKEAIDTINSFLSEYKNELCCIIVGYEKEINNCFFKFNPGLKRRFPWIYTIDNYTDTDLSQICLKKISEINWKLDNDINITYLNSIIKNNRIFFKNFGGDIETFISKLKMLHSKRVFPLPISSKFIITKTDIDNTFNYLRKHIKQKEDTFPLGLYL